MSSRLHIGLPLFTEAEKIYRALGVDVDAAFRRVAEIPVSIHCWQGDDVHGFEKDAGGTSGGILSTGNYPGCARTPEELRADLDQAFKLIPGAQTSEPPCDLPRQQKTG